MSILKNKLLTSNKKRSDFVLFAETQLLKLKDDYAVSIDFLDECKDVLGIDSLIEEIKVEYVAGVTLLKEEVEKNIQILREEVDKINKNTRWMNSERSIGNMDDLNRTIGKLMALLEDIEKSKDLISVENPKKFLKEQMADKQASLQ